MSSCFPAFPVLLAVGLITGASGADRQLENADVIVARANSWTEGSVVPQELIKFRDLGSDMPPPDDTIMLFGKITNCDVLWAIILNKDTDSRVFDTAVARALKLGLNNFFSRYRRLKIEDHLPIAADRRSTLEKYSRQKHVAVAGLMIKEPMTPDGERGKYLIQGEHGQVQVQEERGQILMPAQEREQVFEEIAQALKSGRPFWDVYREFAKRYSYVKELDVWVNGKKVQATRTKVGRLGDFVLSPTRHDDRPFRPLASVPLAHVDRLLTMTVGQTVVLFDDSIKQWNLYQVTEVYDPAAQSHAGGVP